MLSSQLRQGDAKEDACSAAPFLKWAGGKRWLVEQYSDVFPVDFNIYIEPFLGSGAAFFHLKPKRALLSDINADLINCYQVIKEDWESLENLLELHDGAHCEEYYYRVRSMAPRNLAKRAARFLYLNRTCWNGLYRENRLGEFNVPIGTKDIVLRDGDDFARTSAALENAELVCADFEVLVDRAGRGDLIFVDPPYTVKHDKNGFVRYNEKIFGWSDQIRLRDCLYRARARGAKIVATNAAHESVQELYRDFDQRILSRRSLIGSRIGSRGSANELLITS